MTITYYAGKQLHGLSTDNLPNNLQEGSTILETDTAKLDFIKGGWKELGRTTLGSAGDDITVSGLVNKRYYMLLLDGKVTGVSRCWYRLNGDTTGTYSARQSENGGADATYINRTEGMLVGGATSPAGDSFGITYISNYYIKEKLSLSSLINNIATGAGTAPYRNEDVGKWANTTDSISSIIAHNDDTGSWNTGSEVVVLGYDPTDTHTTNFWEELASVTSLTGGNVDSGTFTAKKYLWVQFELIVNAYDSTNVVIQFNADTAGNYANRISQNGGADSTAVSQTSIATTISGGKRIFGNMFIINNSANEKLVTGHTVVIGTSANSTAEGAGVAPRRLEFVGKWDNTSNQITKIVFDDTIANFVSGQVKVWGSN